jgi:hypothetical protein
MQANNYLSKELFYCTLNFFKINSNIILINFVFNKDKFQTYDEK